MRDRTACAFVAVLLFGSLGLAACEVKVASAPGRGSSSGAAPAASAVSSGSATPAAAPPASAPDLAGH